MYNQKNGGDSLWQDKKYIINLTEEVKELKSTIRKKKLQKRFVADARLFLTWTKHTEKF